MLLANEQLVTFLDNQVRLEGHVQGKENTAISEGSDVSELEGSDPLEDPGVFVDDFALLEVELVAGVLRGHFDKRLVGKGRMVEILLELKKSLKRVAEELGVTQSVRDILVLLLGLDGDVVLIALTVVVVASDRPVQPLLLPLDDVLELLLDVPGSIGDESILVLECPGLFVHDISAREAEVGKLLFGGPVFAEVGVDTRDSVLVGSVKLCDGCPYLSLHSKVVFEVVDDGVVLLDLGLVVVLVKLAGDVVGRAGVLVRQRWIGFIVQDGVFFDLPEVVLFFLEREERE